MEYKFTVIAGPSRDKLLNAPADYKPLFFVSKEGVPAKLLSIFCDSGDHLELRCAWKLCPKADQETEGVPLLLQYESRNPIFYQLYLGYTPEADNHGQIVAYIETPLPVAR